MILTIVISAVLFGGIPKDCKEDKIRFTEMVLVEDDYEKAVDGIVDKCEEIIKEDENERVC